MGKGVPNAQTKNGSANIQKEKDGTGEVASPVKSKPRQRKPRATGGAAADVMQGNIPRVSGHKRKEYRIRVPVLQKNDVVDVPLTVVPEGALILASTVATATGDGGDGQVADSETTKNKKPRSADPAATAVQSRPTQ
jgi:hypothetical protein